MFSTTVPFEIPSIAFMVPICPTNPQVPMPDPSGVFSILKIIVEIGPRIADAIMDGSQIIGFLMMFGICSIEVPIPCASSPSKPLSLYEITANPIMFAQHPTVAAPPANPDSPSMIQIAALLIGNVSIIPIDTDTMTPMISDCCFVAAMIAFPIATIIAWIYGPINVAMIAPTKTVTTGVRTMSILVSLEINFPNSTAKMVDINTPIGPPSWYPATPTTADEKRTRSGAFSEYAMDTAIAGPVAACTIGHRVLDRNSILNSCPMVLSIVPTSNDANSPYAMAPIASIK